MTKLENMINPEVMGTMVAAELSAAMKFTPLCAVDNTLEGRAGDTVTLPKYGYIGDAADVAEGGAIPVTNLTTTSVSVQVKKAGKGVELTDEAVLSGYGDPIGEAARQLGLAIANKVDNDVLAALAEVPESMTAGDGSEVLCADVIADALLKFGEDVEDEKVILIAPEQLATLRKSEDWLKATDIGVDTLIRGTVGSIHGCQVVVSNKIAASEDGTYENYIVKPGALAIYLKRDVQIEKQRDIVHDTTTVTANKHYAAHLANESKAVKLVTKASAVPAPVEPDEPTA